MTRAIRRANANQPRQRRNMPHLAARVFGTPLLVDGRKLDAIIPVFTKKLNGEPEATLSDSDYREDGGNMTIDTSASIAIIPIIGSLIRRPTWLDAWSGLTSYGEIAECLDSAINDARVKGILLQVDSFGGEAAGCFELCDKIYAARSQKPIWAVADVDAFSAGYAILSSAEKCFCDPSGSTGSIGVVAVHCERSQMNAAMGITYTVFRAGDRKAEFNPYEKLTSDAAIKMLTSMEKMRQRFAETVSRNRNSLAISSILETEGQWYDPDDAKTLGLIDDILTYDGVFSQFAASLASPALAPPPPDDDELAPETDLPEDGDGDGDGDNNTSEGDPPPDDGDDPEDNPEDEAKQQTSEVIPMTTANDGKPTPAKAQPAPATPAKAQPAPATAEVIALDSARPNAESREMQIANLCKVGGVPQKATDFILSGKSVAEVQEELINSRAEADAAAGELSNQHPGRITGGGFSSAPNPEAVASWGRHFSAAQAANPVGFPQHRNGTK